LVPADARRGNRLLGAEMERVMAGLDQDNPGMTEKAEGVVAQ